MRLLLSTLLVFAATAQANNQPENLFSCMNAETFELDSACLETSIDQNVQLRDMRLQIEESTLELGDNAMATVTYYPKQFLIEVVAHPDAVEDKALSASLLPEASKQK